MSIPATIILLGEHLTWEDLKINDDIKEEINKLKKLLKHKRPFIHQERNVKPSKRGCHILFHGPSGTGKTSAAGLLGREVEKEVYKIDLSKVTSKYVGETEKNLKLLFANAEDKGWILVLDEADALFGKRTDVKDAHDKYANVEVSTLLQHIADYKGVMILTTNNKKNIDDIYMDRFDSILQFSLPDADRGAKM